MADRVPAARRLLELLLAGLVFAAVAAVLLHASLFGGKVLTQADALLQFEPWRSAAPDGYRPGNPLLLDQATGFLPWNDFVAEELRRGELPLWCPYNYAGIPLVGTYQSAIYWPLNWIHYAWPSWDSYAWIALCRLVGAAAFAFLFLRKLGVGAAAAAVGGIGFMLSGFMVAWLNHPHANVAMLLPALLWAVERAAARPGWRAASLFGLLFGLQLLGGHAQTSLHVGILVGCYALWRTTAPVRGRRLAPGGLLRLGAGALLGVALAAPQILPFLEYLAHSQAGAEFARPDLVASAGITDAMVLMVDPDHYGAPHTHDYEGPLGPNLNYNELIGGYVGRAMLGLVALWLCWSAWRGRARAAGLFFALAVAAAALIAWQVEPIHQLARELPVLRSTKLMRLLLFVAFGLSVLGAIGLDGVLRRIATGWVRGALAVAALLAVAAELLCFAHGYNPEVDPALVLPRTATVAFLQEDRSPHRVLAVDNTVLKPNANVFHRIPMLSGYDSMEDAALTELLLRCTNQQPDYPFVSQIGAWNRIEAFPLLCLLGVKYVLADAALPAPLRPVHEGELIAFENPAALPRAFVADRVELVTDPAERVARMTAAGFEPRVALLHEDGEALRRLRAEPAGVDPAWTAALGATAPGPARAEVRVYEPRQIEIEVAVSERSLLVVTDLWDAGWQAEVRSPQGSLDVPIERVDHALRGVFVEPGTWTVVMRYAPWSTTIGLGLAALALVGFGLLASRAQRSAGQPSAQAAAGPGSASPS
jgi:hypothetical protein